VRSKRRLEPGAIYWNPQTGEIQKELLENFDAVIHLAGENISSGRWTKRKKKALFLSRCRDTWLLSQTLSRLSNPPKVLICASATGYYGNRGEEILTEKSGKGSGFIADLCEKWEQATSPLEKCDCRVVHARFGAILSPSGGILGKLLPTFRLGLGGRLGSGQQIISWIALDDAIGALEQALLREDIEGALNVTAPHPVTQQVFTAALADQLKKPAPFVFPRFLLRLLIGEMADEVLLASARALPQRLEETGYHFLYPTLKDALKHVLTQ
jgi:uncharacterized protein (TIGR01777 family)